MVMTARHFAKRAPNFTYSPSRSRRPSRPCVSFSSGCAAIGYPAGRTTLMVAYLNVEQRVAGGIRVARRRPRFLGRDSHVAYAFIAPTFFLLVVLVAYPFMLSIWFSLSDARV